MGPQIHGVMIKKLKLYFKWFEFVKPFRTLKQAASALFLLGNPGKSKIRAGRFVMVQRTTKRELNLNPNPGCVKYIIFTIK
jgi:hypothetical protein